MPRWKPFEERFWERTVEAQGPLDSYCIMWTGSINSAGYGVTTFEGRYQLVHRISLILSGAELTKDYLACHKCDVKLCVNAEHLYVGTYSSNSKDMWARGRYPTKTHCRKNHEFTEDNTYYRPPDFKHRTCLTCKSEYDSLRYKRLQEVK